MSSQPHPTSDFKSDVANFHGTEPVQAAQELTRTIWLATLQLFGSASSSHEVCERLLRREAHGSSDELPTDSQSCLQTVYCLTGLLYGATLAYHIPVRHPKFHQLD